MQPLPFPQIQRRQFSMPEKKVRFSFFGVVAFTCCLPFLTIAQMQWEVSGGSLWLNGGDGFRLNVGTDFFPKNTFTVKAELGFSKRLFQKLTYHSFTQSELLKINAFYAEASLPLVANMHFKDWKLFATCGPTVGIAINPKGSQVFIEDMQEKWKEIIPIRNYNMELFFGAGIAKTIGENRELFFMVTRNFGLTDIQTEAHRTFFHRGFAFTLGMGFPLKIQSNKAELSE